MANKTLNTKNLKASLTLEKDLTSKTTVKEIKGVSEIKTAAGSRVQKEQLLDFTEKTGVSILELRADSASRTLDDVRTELDEIIRSNFSPTFNSCMEFYKTKKVNPIYVTEQDIIKIGECRLEIDKEYLNYNDREIRITMKFGGTFIDVTAIHVKSGKTVKTTLTFD